MSLSNRFARRVCAAMKAPLGDGSIPLVITAVCWFDAFAVKGVCRNVFPPGQDAGKRVIYI